ncbi:MAG: hypothetical protein WCW63_05380 [Acholeplasmataceae bacterium]
MKRAILLKSIMFAFTLIAFLTSAIFAWMTFSEQTQSIILYHGNIKEFIEFYQLIDPDYDGEDINDQYMQITSPKVFSNVTPGQIYAFKLEVTNQGTIPAHLSVELNLSATSDLALKEVMKITYTSPTDEDSYLEDSMLLFDFIVLEVDQTYTFYFNIIISGDMGNTFKNKSLIIENLTIRLDQIQPDI